MKTVHQIEYMVGKSRDEEGANSLAERTQAILDAVGSGQTAFVRRIANGHGIYGWRVNVTSKVEIKRK